MNDTLETSSLKKFPDVIYEEASIANKNLLHYGSHSWSTKKRSRCKSDFKHAINVGFIESPLNPNELEREDPPKNTDNRQSTIKHFTFILHHCRYH
jgi:hypothetical protein